MRFSDDYNEKLSESAAKAGVLLLDCSDFKRLKTPETPSLFLLKRSSLHISSLARSNKFILLILKSELPDVCVYVICRDSCSTELVSLKQMKCVMKTYVILGKSKRDPSKS